MKLKKHLLLGRKAMTNLDSILKSRDITLPTKFLIFKAMVFPVVMYRCETWTKKKAERPNDAFKLWCWRRLLRVPWTTSWSNQSILKEISPEYSLEGLMLKLKLQPPDASSQLIGKRLWYWERLKTGGKGDDRGWDGWMASLAGWHHWLDGRESEWTPGVGDGQGGLACFDSWGRKESDTTERLNWTELSLSRKHLLISDL